MNQEVQSAYVHFPFCVKKCAYCDFVSFAGKSDQMEPYVEALCKEIQLTRAESILEDSYAGLSTVYLGGGTPSHFSRVQIKKVLTQLEESFGINKDAEITLEVNPGTVDYSNFAAYRAIGINRISIGIQSFSPALLSTLGRIHTSQQGRDAISAARAAGFINISCDLMTGLPGQTRQDVIDSLSELIENEVPHISFYALSVEEGTPFYDYYHHHEDRLPDADLERDMYHSMIKILQQKGYNHYEISNCSLPGMESRHNMTYWKALPYYGFGCGACSFRNEWRTGNTTKLDEYISLMLGPASQLSDIKSDTDYITLSESRKEFMMLGFRLIQGVSIDEFAKRFDVQMNDIFGVELAELIAADLIFYEDGSYRLSRKGLDYANQVFRAFV
jgi:oxygen-independent coproporphyrinogen-3 oxidase